MALETLTKNTSSSMRCKIEWNGDAGYEVVDGEYMHVVDIRKETCTYPHAIVSLHKQDLDPIKYVSNWYRKDTYTKTYCHYIQPVLNMKMWSSSTHPSIEPPVIKVMPGRPKKNKRRDKNEVKKIGKYTMKGAIMTCSHCKQQCHNKKGCAQLKYVANQAGTNTPMSMSRTSTS